MLAAMKLGAVIIPASTLLTYNDLLDRFRRGRVRHVVTSPEHVAKFKGIATEFTRIVAGGEAIGWLNFEEAQAAPESFDPAGETKASDPLFLYFTSGTTAKPKLVLHSHQSYPVGHLSTMYWIGLRPRDLHLNISSPGWAKHAWSCFFAPWNAGATVFMFNQARFNARAVLDAIVRHGVTTFCAPPTVWRLLIQEDLASWKVTPTDLASAGEPLNPEVIAQVQGAWGSPFATATGRPKPRRNSAIRPASRSKRGPWGGRCRAFACNCSTATARRGTKARSACRTRCGRPASWRAISSRMASCSVCPKSSIAPAISRGATRMDT